MLRRVELDATRDPRPQQANQRRLDDALPVEEVVAIADVLSDVNAAADLRQDHQSDVLVLEVDGLPGTVDLVI